MKQRYLILLAAAMLQLTAWGVPARRVFKPFVQPDQTTVMLSLAGDEYHHFYINTLGEPMQRNEQGFWVKMTEAEIQQQDIRWQAARKARAPKTADRKRIGGLNTTGEHRLLTILVEFSNLKFSNIGSVDTFNDMLNGENYTFQGATGSARKYFMDQSIQTYFPRFDIIGPVTLDNTYQYYGQNNVYGNDAKPQEMVQEGIEKAIELGLIPDPSVYDADGDGYIDLVYVFYAGFSEAENAGNNYIWPHQWNLSSPYEQDGLKYYRYACSSELMGLPPTKPSDTLTIDGIGSCVHEFSHCLGLPDFYNTGSQLGCYGMDAWSIMDQGCYNNGGKTPPSYTAYERSFVGWCELDTLPLVSGTVTLPTFDDKNKAYVYYNPNNPDEFITFENHQPQGWDRYFGGYTSTAKHGMLVVHVDYLKSAWENNAVNNNPNHQRCTVLPADGDLLPYDTFYTSNPPTQSSWYENYRGDIFPGYNTVTELKGSQVQFFTGDTATWNITDIIENPDGSVTFELNYPSVNSLDHIENCGITHDIIYDITGKPVNAGIESLPRGMYIIHSSKGIRKICIP